MALVHQHLLIRAHVSNPPRSEEVLNKWLTDLVSAVRMKVCIPARSYYVDTPGNEGLTGQIGLSTSHAAVHIWDDTAPGLVQMDLYSCSEFESLEVVTMLREWGLLDFQLWMIDRNRDFFITEQTQSM